MNAPEQQQTEPDWKLDRKRPGRFNADIQQKQAGITTSLLCSSQTPHAEWVIIAWDMEQQWSTDTCENLADCPGMKSAYQSAIMCRWEGFASHTTASAIEPSCA